MNVALVGAVESSRIALEVLTSAGLDSVTLLTLPTDKLHRHSDAVDLRPAAARYGVECVETANINSDETLDLLRQLDIDFSFVIGWSQICRSSFLGVARRGTIGYHPAPLPENRGRAVIPWTILQGRDTTGSTLFWMDEGMDSGDVLGQETFPVSPSETATTLYQKHMDSLARILATATESLKAGDAPRRPQDHSLATYCSQRRPEDGLIDWTRPASEIERLIRATTRPYPGAFTTLRGESLVVWRAALEEDSPYWGTPGQVQTVDDSGALVQCGGRGHIRLVEVEPEGGESVSAHQVLARQDRLGR
jgi:methionyl-tRNA formyltransferase